MPDSAESVWRPGSPRKPVDPWTAPLTSQWVRAEIADVQAVVAISDAVLAELHLHGFEIMRRFTPEDFEQLNDGPKGNL